MCRPCTRPSVRAATSLNWFRAVQHVCETRDETSFTAPPVVVGVATDPGLAVDLGPFESSRALSWEAPLPRLHRVRRHRRVAPVPDIERAVAEALGPVREKIAPGCSIAVTVGSRGIAGLATIYRSVGKVLSGFGGRPFLVAAMGSHGNANAAGRLGVLASLGLSEDEVGMPIVSTEDLTWMGELSHGPVRIAKQAADADLILAVNRVKPHTDFHGAIESGLAKILAIGLGNQSGAALIHAGGPDLMSPTIVAVSDLLVATGKVLGGLAVLENDEHEVADIVFVDPAGIGHAEESALLGRATAMMGLLPFDELDVLVVSELGKEISGAGIDPNVIGRMRIEGTLEPERPRVGVIVVLGLSEATAGNGSGLGLADLTTLRAVGQLDVAKTYRNALTAGRGGIRRAALPIALATDRDAICAALAGCGERRPERRRLMCIQSTLALSEFLVSESLRPLVESDACLEVVEEMGPMPFSADGTFVGWTTHSA